MRRRRRKLDDLVEAVLSGKPLPSGRSDPADAEFLRVAIELRASRPGADLPDGEFVTGLRQQFRTAAAAAAAAAPKAAPAARLPRRALLAGAAGALAAGAWGRGRVDAQLQRLGRPRGALRRGRPQ